MAIAATSGAAASGQAFPGRISTSRTPGRLSIDSTQPRQEMGYYSYMAFVSENTRIALRQVTKGIADTVATGDKLMRIEDGGNPLRSLARERASVRDNDTQVVLAFIPLSPPAISYTPGTLSIDIVY